MNCVKGIQGCGGEGGGIWTGGCMRNGKLCTISEYKLPSIFEFVPDPKLDQMGLKNFDTIFSTGEDHLRTWTGLDPSSGQIRGWLY